VAGVAKRARSQAERAEPAANDQALADRVKSEIFRPAESPKDSVSVNVENGVVFLRGEVKRPEQIDELVETTRSVEGVKAVQSLLHTPKTPAPMKGDGKATRVGEQAP
jgi:osmotically-inducible protein OsmY